MSRLERRRTFLILLSTLPLLACERKIDLSPRKVKWDQDVCTRCAMLLSDPLNSAQIIDPETGKAFMFDDLGCAIAWLDETRPAWHADAVVYVNEATDGAWLRLEEAVLATPYITPMSFGIAAFRSEEKVDDGKTLLTISESRKMVLDAVRERKQKSATRGHHG